MPIDLAIERDRKRIDNPIEWPHFRLPLKRPNPNGGWPDFGWLFTGMEWKSDQRIVFLGNVFDTEASGTEVYESTQALLDAGWQVD